MELTQAQIDWLDKCTQGTWSLNKSGLVDIDGDFDCTRQDLKDFKGVKFGKVKGSFDCRYNKLTSLEGAPQEVGWSFNCRYNKLTSLVGAPQVVKGYFGCSYNKLTSLEGAPQEVRFGFDCHDNPISETTLELIHKTMVERNLPYIIALGLLKTRINKKEFDKLSSGYNEGSLNAASIMSRFV